MPRVRPRFAQEGTCRVFAFLADVGEQYGHLVDSEPLGDLDLERLGIDLNISSRHVRWESSNSASCWRRVAASWSSSRLGLVPVSAS